MHSLKQKNYFIPTRIPLRNNFAAIAHWFPCISWSELRVEFPQHLPGRISTLFIAFFLSKFSERSRWKGNVSVSASYCLIPSKTFFPFSFRCSSKSKSYSRMSIGLTNCIRTWHQFLTIVDVFFRDGQIANQILQFITFKITKWARILIVPELLSWVSKIEGVQS